MISLMSVLYLTFWRPIYNWLHVSPQFRELASAQVSFSALVFILMYRQPDAPDIDVLFLFLLTNVLIVSRFG